MILEAHADSKCIVRRGALLERVIQSDGRNIRKQIAADELKSHKASFNVILGRDALVKSIVDGAQSADSKGSPRSSLLGGYKRHCYYAWTCPSWTGQWGGGRDLQIHWG